MGQLSYDHRRMRLVWLVPCIAAGALFCGCQVNPADQVLGDWKLDASQFKTANLGNKLGSIIKSGNLHFSKDKTFTLNFQEIAKGTYTVNDRTVTLTTQTIDGQPVAKLEAISPVVSKLVTIQGTLGPNGQSLTISANGKPTKFLKVHVK